MKTWNEESYKHSHGDTLQSILADEAASCQPSQLPNKPQHPAYPYGVFSVGDRVHLNRYTDTAPATVTAVRRNGTEVEVRVDNYELAPGEKPEIMPGSFAGHCTNQRQLKYVITESSNAGRETFTLRKWRGRFCWTPKESSPDGHQRVAPGWAAFYDYNF